MQRASINWRWPLAYVLLVGVLGSSWATMRLIRGNGSVYEGLKEQAQIRYAARVIVQENADKADENEVMPEQIDKFVSVYKAMQKDKNLTVDQATERQGISIEAFRDIEHKIERDELVRDRVRRMLVQSAEKQTPKGEAHPETLTP